MTVRMDIKLDIPSKTEFRNYLKSLKESDVTKFCKGGNCPIAQYVVDHSTLPKGSTVHVDDYVIRITNDRFDEIEFYADLWMGDFIHEVDALRDRKTEGLYYGHKDRDAWVRVTPAEALKVLGK